MRIALLTSHRVPSAQSVTQSCLDLLASWGTQVEVVHEQRLTNLIELRVDHDLYLLKSPSAGTLSVAAGLQARGAKCINTPQTVLACRDRIHATTVLAAAGVPLPHTWTAESGTDLAELLTAGPIVVKSTKLDRSGSRIIWDADEIIDLPRTSQAIFAQQFHPSDHRDRKLYRIGDQTFGVKRAWPAISYEDKVGEPFAVTTEMREISDKVAGVLDSELFGLDLVVSDDGLLVVDVHPFPGFKGVPDAALRLADYIYAQGRAA